jgi:hypothetical protein
MKKLSKDTLAGLTRMRADIEAAHAEAQSAASDLNEILSRLRGLIEVYNNGLFDASEEVRAYIDTRSEKWQDGEQGDLYAAWAGELEGSQLDADQCDDVEVVDLEFPELPELEA